MLIENLCYFNQIVSIVFLKVTIYVYNGFVYPYMFLLVVLFFIFVVIFCNFCILNYNFRILLVESAIIHKTQILQLNWINLCHKLMRNDPTKLYQKFLKELKRRHGIVFSIHHINQEQKILKNFLKVYRTMRG